jgi:GNAT superfamily N-acetyltransferase
MDELQIQRATTHELADLVPLFAGYLRFYGKPADPARIASFLGERLRGGQSVVFLAYRGEQAVGFVQLYPVFSSLALAPAWLLNDLFVAPRARGAGAGRALMEAARGLAEDTGASEVQLQTARDNLDAQRLYQALGYQRDDVFLVYSLGLHPG